MNDEYKKIANGPFCAVMMSKKALKVFYKADAGERRRAERIVSELSDNGRKNLNPQSHFKNEGNFPSGVAGMGDVTLYAVKGNKLLRIYGGFVQLKEKAFFCIESNVKKQNKADQNQLKRVAKKLGKLNGDN